MKMSKQNAAHYIWGAQCDGWHLVQNETLSIIHERMPAGTAEIRHYHSVSRQFFSSSAVKRVWNLMERRLCWKPMKE